jgi:hypothetical protein
LQRACRLLELATLLAARGELRVGALRGAAQTEVEHVQHRQRPRRVLLEDRLEACARALLVCKCLDVVVADHGAQELEVLEQHLVVGLLESGTAQLLELHALPAQLRHQARVAHVELKRRSEPRTIAGADRLRDRLSDLLRSAEAHTSQPGSLSEESAVVVVTPSRPRRRRASEAAEQSQRRSLVEARSKDQLMVI